MDWLNVLENAVQKVTSRFKDPGAAAELKQAFKVARSESQKEKAVANKVPTRAVTDIKPEDGYQDI